MHFNKLIKKAVTLTAVLTLTVTSLPSTYSALAASEESLNTQEETTADNLTVVEKVSEELNLEVETVELDLYQDGNEVEEEVEIVAYNAAQTVQEYIISQYEALSTSIVISSYNISKDDIQSVIQDIINNNPQLFYVSGGFSISYNQTTGMVYAVLPNYNYDASEIPTKIAEFNSAVDEVLKCVSSDMTDVEKALAVHDYMVINYKYDFERYQSNTLTAESYSAYGIMTNKTGVCNAYALAYEYIMDNCLGIDCSLVTSETMNHAWNLIQIGGQYYHVDVTWDDPTWDRLGDCEHDFFLVSDSKMQNELEHFGFTTGSAVSTTYDNSFWAEVSTSMEYYNGSWYYIENDGDVMKNDFVAGSSQKIYTVSQNWPVWGNTGSIWSGIFSGLEVIDGRVYFNTPTEIKSMTTSGSDVQTVCAPSTSTGYIYGIAYLDNVLYYVLETTCNIEKAQTLIAVSSLSGSDNSSTEETTTQGTTASANITYRTHVQGIGWQSWVSNGATGGTVGQSKRLEGIQIQETGIDGLDVRYSTHVQSIGWQDWVNDGSLSGTSGQSKRLEAIRVELTGSKASEYDIYYRVQAQTYGWLGWAKNGECAGTSGQSKRLEAIQIVVLPKGETPSDYNSSTSAYVTGPLTVSYRTHVQTYGWQSWLTNGAMSGTSGKAKRLEAIQISLANTSCTGSISYRTHVQTYGWQNWVGSGQLSGTSGESKRLEAIQIALSGEMAERYDIYYRVHAQTYGWLGWAKNGESAGTSGYSKRLEAIEIVLVEKGGSAPGSTANAYVAK